MYQFIFFQQPKSYNAWRKYSQTKKRKYRQLLESKARNYNSSIECNENAMYGIVYYFYKYNNSTDADNISKPIWDCLNGILYNDDQQIKLRIAGCLDIVDILGIDITKFSTEVLNDFLLALDDEDNIVYVECGKISENHYLIGME